MCNTAAILGLWDHNVGTYSGRYMGTQRLHQLFWQYLVRPSALLRRNGVQVGLAGFVFPPALLQDHGGWICTSSSSSAGPWQLDLYFFQFFCKTMAAAVGLSAPKKDAGLRWQLWHLRPSVPCDAAKPPGLCDSGRGCRGVALAVRGATKVIETQTAKVRNQGRSEGSKEKEDKIA